MPASLHWEGSSVHRPTALSKEISLKSLSLIVEKLQHLGWRIEFNITNERQIGILHLKMWYTLRKRHYLLWLGIINWIRSWETNSRIFLLNFFFPEFFKTIIVMKNKERLRNCCTWKRWKKQLNKVRILQPLVEEITNAVKGIIQLTNWNVDGK